MWFSTVSPNCINKFAFITNDVMVWDCGLHVSRTWSVIPHFLMSNLYRYLLSEKEIYYYTPLLYFPSIRLVWSRMWFVSEVHNIFFCAYVICYLKQITYRNKSHTDEYSRFNLLFVHFFGILIVQIPFSRIKFGWMWIQTF